MFWRIALKFAVFDYPAAVTGASVDIRKGIPHDRRAFCRAYTSVVKVLAAFLLSYPLAGLLKRIPDRRPDWKNLYIVGYEI